MAIDCVGVQILCGVQECFCRGHSNPGPTEEARAEDQRSVWVNKQQRGQWTWKHGGALRDLEDQRDREISSSCAP